MPSGSWLPLEKYVTLSEMCAELKEVFGVYEEQTVFKFILNRLKVTFQRHREKL